VRRGAYVTEMSEKDLRDVYHLLSLLESDAAGVVAERATPEQQQTLKELHAELEGAVADREKFFAVNERFHMLVLEMADNRWRSQMVADLRKVMKLNRHNSLFKQGRIEDSLAEHRAILEAMLARDAVGTRQAMQTHFAQGLEAAT
jgi:DNA-binding GntR family transcriptional regulator